MLTYVNSPLIMSPRAKHPNLKLTLRSNMLNQTVGKLKNPPAMPGGLCFVLKRVKMDALFVFGQHPKALKIMPGRLFAS